MVPEGTAIPDCTHFDVCGRGATHASDGKPYCILHDPVTDTKHADLFAGALNEHLAHGRCSFGHFRLPQEFGSLHLTGRTFEEVVELFDIQPPRPIQLDGATLRKGAVVSLDVLAELTFSRAVSGGTIAIQADRMQGNTIHMVSAVVAGDVILRVKRPGIHVYASDALVEGRVVVEIPEVLSLSVERSTLKEGLTILAESVTGMNVSGAMFHNRIDLSGLEIHQDLSFRRSTFHSSATMSLSGSTVTGLLELVGSTLPYRVYLNGLRVLGDTRIEAPVGTRPMTRLVAREQEPRLEGKVTLKTVDLSECRLVGNALQDFELSGIGWEMIPTFCWKYASRVVLYDEVTTRKNDGPPARDVQEAYEKLKENYRSMGDHVRSGDFHYGEMRMKLRDRRIRRNIISSELWFGLASGFGTRPGRAFAVLLGMLVVAAGFYYCREPGFFQNDMWKAVRFSAEVATLQRPEVPRNLDSGFRSLVVVETILGPIQIALYVLALRMRVRR